MNRKLQRYLTEIEKTEQKIADLQQHLKDLRLGQKQEEDLEMVRVIRGMKLGSKDLLHVLNGLQDGTMSIQDLMDEAQMEEVDEPEEFTASREEDTYETEE